MSTGLNKEFAAAKTDNTTDQITGLCNSDVYLEQLYDHCINAKETTYLITSDFINLSQLNSVIGRNFTNQVIQTIAAIYQDELGSIGAEINAGFRTNGDELNFIIGGDNLPQKQLTDALKRAEERTNAFVDDAKLSQIQHPRFDNVTGTGMTTTFTEINKFSRPITETKNGLSFQIKNMRGILPKTTRNAQRASEFVHESYLETVQTALVKHKPLKIETKPRLPQGFTFSPIAQDQVRFRHEEVGHLKDAIAKGDFHFMRFNLYNLGGLNSLFGNDMVNKHILDVAAQVILETLREEGLSDCPIYKRNGGEFDVICENTDQQHINRIKAKVTNKLQERIFSKTIRTFAAENDITLLAHEQSVDIPVGNIRHKRGRLPGSGFTIIYAPVPQNTNINAVFQNVESTQRLYEYHGLTYAGQSNNNTLQLRSIIAQNNALQTLNYESLGADGSVDYAWSLSDRLKPEQLQDIFKKPVGMIFEALTGISLLPVLDRQQLIFHLISQGVEIEKITANLSPREKFDQFVQDQVIKEKINPVDLAGRPSSRPHGHTEFLTFNLAEAWGYIPPKLDGIEQTILKAQAAIRALQELHDYKTRFRNDDSATLLPEIRERAQTILADAGAQSDALETAQYVDHATKVLKHLNSIEDAQPCPDVIRAGYSLVHETLLDIAQDFKRFGHHNLAENISNLTQTTNLGAYHMRKEEAFAVYDSALNAETHETKVVLEHTLQNG